MHQFIENLQGLIFSCCSLRIRTAFLRGVVYHMFTWAFLSRFVHTGEEKQTDGNSGYRTSLRPIQWKIGLYKSQWNRHLWDYQPFVKDVPVGSNVLDQESPTTRLWTGTGLWAGRHRATEPTMFQKGAPPCGHTHFSLCFELGFSCPAHPIAAIFLLVATEIARGEVCVRKVGWQTWMAKTTRTE